MRALARAAVCADEVNLSRKGQTTRSPGRRSRSPGAEQRAPVRRGHKSAVELEKKLATRTRELAKARQQLAEALEQQTATSNVLQVISSSPGELEPVFQAMLANATRLCEAKFGTLYLYESDAFRPVAQHNVPSGYAEARTPDQVFRPPSDMPLGWPPRCSRTTR